jgi:hypothetical protein
MPPPRAPRGDADHGNRTDERLSSNTMARSTLLSAATRRVARHMRRPAAYVALASAVAVVGAMLLARRRCARRARRRRLRPGPVTQSLVSVNAADAPLGAPGCNTELRLDEAIQETFPASDPIAVHIE